MRIILGPLEHRTKVRRGLLLALPLVGLLLAGGQSAKAGSLSWVEFDPVKGLSYHADSQGNRIPDFSYAGYGGGGVKLPAISAQATLSPGKGDATARIQEALDKLASSPPDAQGFRGALLLKRGKYLISGQLHIRASGMVLRGEGDGEHGTVLIATGTDRRPLIKAGGFTAEGEAPEWTEIKATEQPISNPYLPVGTHKVAVPDTSVFQKGDTVLVRRNTTAEWIHAIGMDAIPERSDGRAIKQWVPGKKELAFDRIITAVRDGEIEVDAPICNAIEQEYGGGSVSRYELPGRLENIGIENLRGVSEFSGPKDEEHSWTFIELGALQNGWVRNVTAVHFAYSCVFVHRPAKWITIQDSLCLDPVSKITGGRRYSFCLMGQLTLVQRCQTRNGRHDYVLHSAVPGPNVFLDCSAEEAHSDTGPHHRWSVGVLYDNVRVKGDAINIRNRSNFGTGHGWSGANQVVWNCVADAMNIEQPPTAQNWAIGCVTPERQGNAYWESFGKPVQPRSLYLQQLQERLGVQAVRNISK